MCNIGYIDDKNDLVEDYQEMFSLVGINLLFCKNCKEKNDILEWICDNQISTLIIDYKLNLLYQFSGNDLLNYLSSELPDLPCIILTSHQSDAINSENVPSFLVYEKDELVSEDNDILFNVIKKCPRIFENRLKERAVELKKLIEKKKSRPLSNYEEERFLHLYKILRSYDEVDDIPCELLTSEIEKKLDCIIRGMKELLND